MFSFLTNNISPSAFRRASVNFSPRALAEDEVSPFRTLGSRFNFGVDNSTKQSVLNDVSDPGFQEPESPVSDLFTKFLSSAPNPEDYKASGWRRFGAALAGLGAGMRDPVSGVMIAEKINRQPYDTAVERYNSEGAVLEQMAKLEALGQKNSLEYKRLYQEYLNNKADNEREDRKVGLTESGQQLERDKFDYTKTKDERELQFKYDELTERGWKESYDASGNLIMVNPTNGATANFGPSFKKTEMSIEQQNANSRAVSADASITSADAAARNADTNASRLRDVEIPNAGAYRSEAESRNLSRETGRENAGRVPVREQIYAEAQAARELMQEDTGYDGYYNFETGELNGPMGFRDQTKFNEFRNKLKTKTNEVLKRKYKDLRDEEIDFNNLPG